MRTRRQIVLSVTASDVAEWLTEGPSVHGDSAVWLCSVAASFRPAPTNVGRTS